MGGGHSQNMMHLLSYVPPLDLHIIAGLEEQAFLPYTESSAWIFLVARRF
jgi:hypothetical protein